ncbi:MAG: phage tail assembly chaperone [Bacillota bacterium]
MNDPLQAFLNADLNIEEDVYIKRLGVHIRIKALLEETVNNLKEQATHFVGKGQHKEKRFNSEEFSGLVVAEACVNINFGDSKMLERYGAKDAGDCVGKALLTGEVTKLTEAIFLLSGYDDDDELLEEAKN